ncbi:MAG: hypothetical protein IPL55_18060 [Saprospiraceae bacterium]|jgi:hypothetical protein|nr:hypothetical protein [Saprospiraceae bacterium]
MKNLIKICLICCAFVSCKLNKIAIYKDIKKHVENDCDLLSDYFDQTSKCKIMLSNKIIPVNVTPFYQCIDTLPLIKTITGVETFNDMNFFDLANHKQIYVNESLNLINNKYENFTIKLFCSDIISNLVTCEAVEISNFNSNNELIFGNSMLYLFYLDSNNKVKKLSLISLKNN